MICEKCNQNKLQILITTSEDRFVAKLRCDNCEFSEENIVKQKLKNKSFEFHIPGYNYCGPGTNILYRLHNNIQPVNKVDQACMRHDINYMLSKTGITNITKSDIEFLNDLDKIKKDIGLYESLVLFFVKKIIKIKIILDVIFDGII